VVRKQDDAQWESMRFKPGKMDLNTQYYSLYNFRSEQLTPRVRESCRQWESKATYVNSVVHTEVGKLSYVIGTLYLDAPERLNILEEITREAWVVAPEPKEKYTSQEDQLILEDSNGRMPLVGDCLNQHVLVTGKLALT
jgi:DNA polymerase delta subunit 2